jgi:hypothetical protein
MMRDSYCILVGDKWLARWDIDVEGFVMVWLTDEKPKRSIFKSFNAAITVAGAVGGRVASVMDGSIIGVD